MSKGLNDQNKHQSNAAATGGPLMDIHDLAAYLGVSVSWIKQNPAEIPYIRLGSKLKRWTKEAADAYITKNTRGVKAAG